MTHDVVRSIYQGYAMNLDEALRQLSAGLKTTRLNSLMPTIEQKLVEGITHGEILAVLNANGFALTERTYKSYLYRYRRRRRTSGLTPVVGNRIERARSVNWPTTDGAHMRVPTPPLATAPGPKTFEFNAGGLPPELLK